MFINFRLCRICATIFIVSTCSAFLLLPHPAPGQRHASFRPGDYSVSHYDDRNGLPQNSVKSLAQGPDGFVWLTTENGLVRFDGNSFYVFDESNVAIRSSRFQTIQPDLSPPFNRFYARQIDDGYLESNDCYFRIEHGVPTADSTAFSRVFKTTGLNKKGGDVYFTAGMPDLAGSYFTPENYIIPVGGEEGAYFHLRGRILTYYESWKLKKQVTIGKADPWKWFRLGKSLYNRTRDRTFERFSFAPKEAGAASPAETALTGDIQNDPLYRSGAGKTRLYWNNTVNQVFLSLDNNLYLLEEAGAGLHTRLLLTDFDLDANLIGTILYSVTSGRLFLGSYIKGLFVIRNKDFRAAASASGGVRDIFYAQTAWDRESVQTPNGRIFSLNGEVSTLLTHKTQAARHGMTEYRLATDRFGNLWTSRNNVLFCFAGDGFTVKGKWELGGEITDIHKGYDGTLWIALAGGLLYQVKYEGTSLGLSLYATLRLGGKRINFLLHEKNDALWVGTGAGVYCFTAPGRKPTLLPGTASYNIRSLYTPGGAAGGPLWITSYNHGFALYENGTLTAFPLDRNRYLATSHYIFEDKEGFFWIPTNKGLFQAEKRELLEYARKKGPREAPYYRYFGTADGFKTNEFNGGCRPCAVRLANGYVSLPSMNGLVFFVPEKLPVPLHREEIYIDRLESQDRFLPITGNRLDLHQDEKNRNLFVSTPFFGNTNNLILSYALTRKGQKPYAGEWIGFNPGEGINVSRLDYGSYTLHVRKRTGFGKNSYLFKSLELNVLPKWYQTWYFRILVALIAAVALYLAQRTGIRQIRKRNRDLERRIAERTGELQETLHSLRFSEGKLTRQLRLYIRMIASISHDIRTPVHYIRVASEGIESYLEDDEIPNARELASTIGLTSRRVVNLLDSMVAFTKSEMSETRPALQRTNLRRLVVEKTELFRPILAAQEGNLSIDIPADFRVVTNPNLLAVVIHNLIDNAVKVKNGNSVYITAGQLDGTVRLMVHDKGPGMDPELVKWLNSSSGEQHAAKPMPEKYDGLGLMMVREIAQVLRIRIFVEIENGTKIHLVFQEDGSPPSTVS